MTARSSSFRRITAGVGAILLAGAAGAGIIFDGDGSGEPGFVPPPRPKAPPPPPANISGGETLIPYPGPPAQPQSRSEKKNPPRPPVMFTKLTSEYGEIDWNARPNDLNNLLNALKAMADVNYDCDHKSFAEIDPDPARNPILYRSGHFHWHLNAQEKAKLREYLLRGGTLILNAGMGSKPFYDSALRIMGEVFPETPVQRLAADHAVFHSYYDIDQVRVEQHGVTVTSVYPAHTLLSFDFKQNGNGKRCDAISRLAAQLLSEDFAQLAQRDVYKLSRYRVYRANGKKEYGFSFTMRRRYKDQVINARSTVQLRIL